MRRKIEITWNISPKRRKRFNILRGERERGERGRRWEMRKKMGKN